MKVTEQVENILRASKLARNSDKELFIIFMQKFGLDLDARQVERFRDMPSFETLRRIRQKLQEQGKYPASPMIGKERQYKGLRMQQFGSQKTDYIEQIILPWGE